MFISFKANPICDATQAEPSFQTEFLRMKRDLVKDGVHIASLSANLRNTKDIGELSNNVKMFNSGGCHAKMIDIIKPLEVMSKDLKSSKPPLLIPIQQQNVEHQLPLALIGALERAKQSTQNVVIMYDDLSSSSNQIIKKIKDIKRLLVRLRAIEEDDDILIHPMKSRNESRTRLINYLKNPKGTYVVPFRNFVGMEANSVIYIINPREYFDDAVSIRCAISRAVAQLCIILEMKHDFFLKFDGNKIIFDTADVDPTFVECSKTINFDAFQCNSCHPNSASSCQSKCLPLQIKQQTSQEPAAIFFKLFTKQKYVCQACINVCHRSHKSRSFVHLGGDKFSTWEGALRFICTYATRLLKWSIFGGTKCCCNDITKCLIIKSNSNSFFNCNYFKDVFLRTFYVLIAVFFPVYLVIAMVHHKFRHLFFNIGAKYFYLMFLVSIAYNYLK